jgi:hypothetical protein
MTFAENLSSHQRYGGWRDEVIKSFNFSWIGEDWRYTNLLHCIQKNIYLQSVYSNKEEQNTKKMNTKMKKKTTTLKEDIKGVYIIKCLFMFKREKVNDL